MVQEVEETNLNTDIAQELAEQYNGRLDQADPEEVARVYDVSEHTDFYRDINENDAELWNEVTANLQNQAGKNNQIQGVKPVASDGGETSELESRANMLYDKVSGFVEKHPTASRLAGAGVLLGTIGLGAYTLTDNPNNRTDFNTPEDTPAPGNTLNESSESDSEERAQDAEGQVSDHIFDGEEDFEEYLSSSVDVGDVDVDKPGYHWVEFENPEEQLNAPVPDEMPNKELLDYNIEEGMRGEGVGEFDSLYLAIERDYDGEGPDVTQYFFIEDEWDSTLSAEENMQEANGRLGSPSYEETDLGVLETLLSENVEGYSEVSDDLPEEYQEWLDS